MISRIIAVLGIYNSINCIPLNPTYENFVSMISRIIEVLGNTIVLVVSRSTQPTRTFNFTVFTVKSGKYELRERL